MNFPLWVCHCSHQTLWAISCHLFLGQLFLCPGPHSSYLSSWGVCNYPFKPACVCHPTTAPWRSPPSPSLASPSVLWLSLRSILATVWAHVGVFSPPSDYENSGAECQLHLRLCMQQALTHACWIYYIPFPGSSLDAQASSPSWYSHTALISQRNTNILQLPDFFLRLSSA